jgi:hypothetical protein
MPWIVELIKTRLATLSRQATYALSFLVCTVVGVLASLATGKFNFQEIATSVGLAIVSAQTIYNVYFKPLDIDKDIQTKFSK